MPLVTDDCLPAASVIHLISSLSTPSLELFMPVSSITDRRIHIQPSDVHQVLSRHMLADGYDIVMDLRKSKGSWVFDSRRGRHILYFFSNFASCPIGYNHARLETPEFRERILEAAINKPANSDIYTT